MSMRKNLAAISKRSLIAAVCLGLIVTTLLVALNKPTIETTISGRTDLGAVSEDKLMTLEKQAGSDQAAAEAAVPTGPGYAQPIPEDALRVPKEKK